MPLPREYAWFPRKSYRWGWGIPARWQGWAVVGVYLVALTASNVLLERGQVVWRVGSFIGITFLLIAVCLWKGEAPRWSWGGENEDRGTKSTRR